MCLSEIAVDVQRYISTHEYITAIIIIYLLYIYILIWRVTDPLMSFFFFFFDYYTTSYLLFVEIIIIHVSGILFIIIIIFINSFYVFNACFMCFECVHFIKKKMFRFFSFADRQHHDVMRMQGTSQIRRRRRPPPNRPRRYIAVETVHISDAGPSACF